MFLHTDLHIQLSLAAMNYLRTHYHAAIDIYKKLSQDNRQAKSLHLHLQLKDSLLSLLPGTCWLSMYTLQCATTS